MLKRLRLDFTTAGKPRDDREPCGHPFLDLDGNHVGMNESPKFLMGEDKKLELSKYTIETLHTMPGYEKFVTRVYNGKQWAGTKATGDENEDDEDPPPEAAYMGGESSRDPYRREFARQMATLKSASGGKRKRAEEHTEESGSEDTSSNDPTPKARGPMRLRDMKFKLGADDDEPSENYRQKYEDLLKLYQIQSLDLEKYKIEAWSTKKKLESMPKWQAKVVTQTVDFACGLMDVIVDRAEKQASLVEETVEAGGNFVLQLYDTRLGHAHERIKKMRGVYQGLEAFEVNPSGATAMRGRHLLTESRKKELRDQQEAVEVAVNDKRQVLRDTEVRDRKQRLKEEATNI